MFKTLFYFFVILISVQHAYSQAGVKWIKQFVSGTNNHTIKDITTDNSGNVYITGMIRIDPYNTDVFTAKYDSLGNLAWSKIKNHSAEDAGVKVLVDNNGNVFIACNIYIAASQSDWGLIKYNAAGDEQWITTSSSNNNPSGDGIYDAEFDNQGNIVMAGYFAAENTAAGYPAFTVIKYNPVSGSQIWRNLSPVNYAYNEIRSIAIDNSGNIYACGYEAHGDPNGHQMVIRKYTSSGDTVWTKLLNPSGDIGDNKFDFGIDVELDAAGNIYGLGSIGAGGILNERNVYVIKLTPSGSIAYEYSYGTLGVEENPVDGWVAASGNYYFTANTVISGSDSKFNTIKLNAAGTIAWNDEINETTLQEYGTEIVGENNPENVVVSGYAIKVAGNPKHSVLLYRYNSTGRQWRKKINFTEPGWDAKLTGVAIGSNHNVYSAGQENSPSFANPYTLRVTDATVSQSANVTAAVLLSLTNIGLEILVQSLTGSGTLTGSFMNNPAGNVSFQDTSANFLSAYRWVIEQLPGLEITAATISMVLNQIPGGSLINNPATVSIYKRVQDGLGPFVKLLTTFANGKLTANVNGFSEFILGSMTDPILVQEEGTEVPQNFVLKQNYPNPFNPATNIGFSVPKGTMVNLTVYDNLGREVAVLVNEYLNRGNYYFQFSGEKLASGLYFYKLVTNNFTETKKMILIK
jgi:hypothetical protein